MSCRLYHLSSTEGETACPKAVMMLTCALDLQVYLGEQYVNNLTLSDVTFLVEGQTFHAHRIALLASSDTFRAMFDGHYKEKEASTIPIPNIRYCVFESMMRCIYTGEVPHAHAAIPPAALSSCQLTGRISQRSASSESGCMFALAGSSHEGTLLKLTMQQPWPHAMLPGLCCDRGSTSCSRCKSHVSG